MCLDSVSKTEVAYLNVEQLSVPYYIRFSNRARRLQMRIKGKILEIIVPKRVGMKHIQPFLNANKPWIIKQFQAINERADYFWPKNFLPGEAITVLGKKRTIDLTYQSTGQTFLQSNRLVIAVHPSLEITKLPKGIADEIAGYLKGLAQQKLEEVISPICNSLNRWPRSSRVKLTTSRWGSCGIHQDIYINWLLILAPEFVFYYVVLHECCHLFYRSHGVRFWKKVESVMPNYKEAEKWLVDFGPYLTMPTSLTSQEMSTDSD